MVKVSLVVMSDYRGDSSSLGGPVLQRGLGDFVSSAFPVILQGMEGPVINLVL